MILIESQSRGDSKLGDMDVWVSAMPLAEPRLNFYFDTLPLGIWGYVMAVPLLIVGFFMALIGIRGKRKAGTPSEKGKKTHGKPSSPVASVRPSAPRLNPAASSVASACNVDHANSATTWPAAWSGPALRDERPASGVITA